MSLSADFATRYEAKRQALRDARAAVAVLEAEVRTYDEIATLFEAQQPEPLAPPELSAPVQHMMPWPPATRRPQRRKGKRIIRLKERPRFVLLTLAAAHPQTCDMAYLIEALERAGQAISAGPLRSMLANHVHRGYAERISPGLFKVTAAGLAATRATLKE